MEESQLLFKKDTPTSNNSERAQVIITNPVHPLYGQALPVVRIQKPTCNPRSLREEESGEFVVVVYPNGETRMLAIRDTSLGNQNISPNAQNLLRLKKLLELAQLVKQLQSKNKPLLKSD
jgi:hypothetical protein